MFLQLIVNILCILDDRFGLQKILDNRILLNSSNNIYLEKHSWVTAEKWIIFEAMDVASLFPYSHFLIEFSV